eukprot:9350671-Pyramimonas_sp.AAC.1
MSGVRPVVCFLGGAAEHRGQTPDLRKVSFQQIWMDLLHPHMSLCLPDPMPSPFQYSPLGY